MTTKEKIQRDIDNIARTLKELDAQKPIAQKPVEKTETLTAIVSRFSNREHLDSFFDSDGRAKMNIPVKVIEGYGQVVTNLTWIKGESHTQFAIRFQHHIDDLGFTYTTLSAYHIFFASNIKGFDSYDLTRVNFIKENGEEYYEALENGGFTHTFGVEKTGYSVGDNANGFKVHHTDHTGFKNALNQLKRPALGYDGYGVWFERETGLLHIDPIYIVRNEDAAKKLASALGELAIYSFYSSSVIYL